MPNRKRSRFGFANSAESLAIGTVQTSVTENDLATELADGIAAEMSNEIHDELTSKPVATSNLPDYVYGYDSSTN